MKKTIRYKVWQTRVLDTSNFEGKYDYSSPRNIGLPTESGLIWTANMFSHSPMVREAKCTYYLMVYDCVEDKLYRATSIDRELTPELFGITDYEIHV